MGAWSHEPFGNDTAADWAYGLDNAKDFSYLESALDRVLENVNDYLDASDSEEAVAAVAVIAKMLGKGTQADAYTESVDIWVAAMQEMPPPALIDKARRVLARVTAGDSELLELWEESDDSRAWHESMASLRSALGA